MPTHTWPAAWGYAKTRTALIFGALDGHGIRHRGPFASSFYHLFCQIIADLSNTGTLIPQYMEWSGGVVAPVLVPHFCALTLCHWSEESWGGAREDLPQCIMQLGRLGQWPCRSVLTVVRVLPRPVDTNLWHYTGTMYLRGENLVVDGGIGWLWAFVAACWKQVIDFLLFTAPCLEKDAFSVHLNYKDFPPQIRKIKHRSTSDEIVESHRNGKVDGCPREGSQSHSIAVRLGVAVAGLEPLVV